MFQKIEATKENKQTAELRTYLMLVILFYLMNLEP